MFFSEYAKLSKNCALSALQMASKALFKTELIDYYAEA